MDNMSSSVRDLEAASAMMPPSSAGMYDTPPAPPAHAQQYQQQAQASTSATPSAPPAVPASSSGPMQLFEMHEVKEMLVLFAIIFVACHSRAQRMIKTLHPKIAENYHIRAAATAFAASVGYMFVKTRILLS
jgi:hypothetical protein